MQDGRATVDAVVSLTGFSLVGGPAYNDARRPRRCWRARRALPRRASGRVPDAEQWGASERGLLPVETTIMVAIPELDGATGPMVFGGRSDAAGSPARLRRGCTARPSRARHAVCIRARRCWPRASRLVALRRTRAPSARSRSCCSTSRPTPATRHGRLPVGVRVAAQHAEGAAAPGLHGRRAGQRRRAARARIIEGNAERLARRQRARAHPGRRPCAPRALAAEIEAQWGPAPGRQQSDGALDLRARRALRQRVRRRAARLRLRRATRCACCSRRASRRRTPSRAFYRWLREDFGAHAVLHFGTHGALEFMPGKQAGLSASCWPDRLIGDLPNFYLYARTTRRRHDRQAPRRGDADQLPDAAGRAAGLYRGLLDLKASLERWRGLAPDAPSDARRAGRR
jgi:magnesium chelatase subunit H